MSWYRHGSVWSWRKKRYICQMKFVYVWRREDRRTDNHTSVRCYKSAWSYTCRRITGGEERCQPFQIQTIKTKRRHLGADCNYRSRKIEVFKSHQHQWSRRIFSFWTTTGFINDGWHNTAISWLWLREFTPEHWVETCGVWNVYISDGYEVPRSHRISIESPDLQHFHAEPDYIKWLN